MDCQLFLWAVSQHLSSWNKSQDHRIFRNSIPEDVICKLFTLSHLPLPPVHSNSHKLPVAIGVTHFYLNDRVGTETFLYFGRSLQQRVLTWITGSSFGLSNPGSNLHNGSWTYAGKVPGFQAIWFWRDIKTHESEDHFDWYDPTTFARSQESLIVLYRLFV